ncbi:eukaryotic elongation factor 2 kinase-like [Centruroides vittatus]|uniref:eukaryotic elongation factor 2 kinase-like n=1 Tax=Centruroides vittatus TaxID=120091 RepID=UPI0035100237
MEEEGFDLVLQPLSFSDIGENISQIQKAENTMPPLSPAMGLKRKKGVINGKNISRSTLVRLQWKEAARKVLHLEDPWEEFHLEKLETEVVRRYRFSALKQDWITDDILVKIAKEPFSHGAMRSCYRLKKHSSFAHTHSWKTACNYVAKRYMEDVEREVYFEDVKLQMDAKLWGEEYNRHNPPKKVDIFQMSVIEFINRPDKPLFHLEHYIEGHYIKYNSNSGFISCENLRLTPQAFSHFTFERSGHELIVVDIQGVGDLYTDPQIHTASGKGYGDGNLGSKGMALFFHSHVCNRICKSLGLSEFDIAPTEKVSSQKFAILQKSSKTQVRGTEELCLTPTEYEKHHLREFLCSRSQSFGSSPTMSPVDDLSPVFHFKFKENHESSDDTGNNYGDDNDSDEDHDFLQFQFSPDSGVGSFKQSRRQRYDSESSNLVYDEHECKAFQELVARKSRPSCVLHEIEIRKLQEANGNNQSGASVLGEIHIEMAKYHELGRFTPDGKDDYDHESALFHLEHAANCGNLEAILTMARIYLQLQHDILHDVSVKDTEENKEIGMNYMLQAARAGNRSAMIHVAKAYDTGKDLGNRLKQSWSEAVYWYNKAISTETADESGEFDGCMEDPTYLLLARQGEMYREGNYGLEKNLYKAGEMFQAAAESAMAAMKGRLANKYYMLAEEMWSEVEM